LPKLFANVEDVGDASARNATAVRSLVVSAVAPPVEPEDDSVVPPLVLKARQMGLDV
jgi:hypothetical protein